MHKLICRRFYVIILILVLIILVFVSIKAIEKNRIDRIIDTTMEIIKTDERTINILRDFISYDVISIKNYTSDSYDMYIHPYTQSMVRINWEDYLGTDFGKNELHVNLICLGSKKSVYSTIICRKIGLNYELENIIVVDYRGSQESFSIIN